MVFATLALRYALARDFKTHRRWALRLFMVVNGVWFFRVGLMFWIAVNQGPVGFDPKTFRGPFLSFWAFADYLLPLAILELYLRTKDRAGTRGQFAMAADAGMRGDRSRPSPRNLATSFRMTTTAEGVETDLQRRIVEASGCTEMQGYPFSRPRTGDGDRPAVAPAFAEEEGSEPGWASRFWRAGCDQGMNAINVNSISATVRNLQAELLDKQRKLAPPSMLDCAAHMLLYFESQDAVHRIAPAIPAGKFDATRANLGYGDAAMPQYVSSAIETASGVAVPLTDQPVPNYSIRSSGSGDRPRPYASILKTFPASKRCGLRSEPKPSWRGGWKPSGASLGLVCIDDTLTQRQWKPSDVRLSGPVRDVFSGAHSRLLQDHAVSKAVGAYIGGDRRHSAGNSRISPTRRSRAHWPSRPIPSTIS